MDAALLSAARFASLAPARTEMLEDGSERIGATTPTGGPELSIPLLTSSLAILVSVRQYPPYSNGQLYVPTVLMVNCMYSNGQLYVL